MSRPPVFQNEFHVNTAMPTWLHIVTAASVTISVSSYCSRVECMEAIRPRKPKLSVLSKKSAHLALRHSFAWAEAEWLQDACFMKGRRWKLRTRSFCFPLEMTQTQYVGFLLLSHYLNFARWPHLTAREVGKSSQIPSLNPKSLVIKRKDYKPHI